MKEENILEKENTLFKEGSSMNHQATLIRNQLTENLNSVVSVVSNFYIPGIKHEDAISLLDQLYNKGLLSTEAYEVIRLCANYQLLPEMHGTAKIDNNRSMYTMEAIEKYLNLRVDEIMKLVLSYEASNLSNGVILHAALKRINGKYESGELPENIVKPIQNYIYDVATGVI